MITRPMAHVLLLAVFAILCSCQTVRVKVDYNDQVDFFDFQEFAFLEAPKKNSKGYVSMGDQSMKNMIRKSLQEKGVTEVESSKADILVAINVSEKDKVYYSNVHPGYYSYGGWGYSHHWIQPEEYTESTIVLAFVDPKTKKALWEGSCKNTSFDTISDENLQKIVNAFFNYYPPLPGEGFEGYDVEIKE
ncbi:MAG: DUF4136 domain-containing protein [Lentisphaerales bacterium]|nr:DUF4136 domain-containing protein [Lentisphaerales bacterium]